MTRKCFDIWHQDRPARLGGGAADALADGNPHAGRFALKWSQHKNVAACEIEARPIERGQTVVYRGSSVRGVCRTIGFAREEGLKLLGKTLV